MWQRITIQEILEDVWFKKNYKPAVFEEKEEANLDDVEAVFKDSEVSCVLCYLRSVWWLSYFLIYNMSITNMWSMKQEHHVTEKKEEQPTSMNAFELISMSRALDLGNLFEEEEVCVSLRLTNSFLPHYYSRLLLTYRGTKEKQDLQLRALLMN